MAGNISTALGPFGTTPPHSAQREAAYSTSGLAMTDETHLTLKAIGIISA